jgi:hypothetical protein
MTYIIKDWACNDLTEYYGEFETFQDAWNALIDRWPTEEDLGEFEVHEKTEPTKEKRYLDPNDPRGAKRD